DPSGSFLFLAGTRLPRVRLFTNQPVKIAPRQTKSSPAAAAIGLEVSVVMPCLNEAETLARCIQSAQRALDEGGFAGEVIVADNGSTDGSMATAKELGARVVDVARKGYGNALMGGIQAAEGAFVIMADADES